MEEIHYPNSFVFQVEDVIYGDNFPLAVRLHLAAWIEEKFSPLLPFNPEDPNHQVSLTISSIKIILFSL
jgi:hypothetical protein